MKAKNRHRGSTFDSFLEDEGLRERADRRAIKAVVAWQLAQAMKRQKLTKTAMARRLSTSRSQLDRLLDPKNDRVSLALLGKAASAIGKRVHLELVDSTR